MDTTCKPGAVGSIPGFSSLLDETKPLPLHNMTLAVGRMFNTHAGKMNHMPTPFTPIPILPALKFYTAPFLACSSCGLCAFKSSG